MNYFLKDGNTFKSLSSNEILEQLPLGTYDIKMSMQGPYLQSCENLKVPELIYSYDNDFIAHVLATKKNWPGHIGILLEGYKGLGKSITAARLCLEFQKEGFVIIKVTNFLGNSKSVLGMLATIKQPHVVVLDELDKSIQEEKSDFSTSLFLSYLDGMDIDRSVDRIILATGNESLTNYVYKRPTRFRYVRKYKGLKEETAIEIIERNLKYPEHSQDLLKTIDWSSCNVDVLTSIIEEINIHNKPFSSFVEFFNADMITEEATVRIEGNGFVITFSSLDCSNSESPFYGDNHTVREILGIRAYVGILTIGNEAFKGDIYIKYTPKEVIEDIFSTSAVELSGEIQIVLVQTFDHQIPEEVKNNLTALIVENNKATVHIKQVTSISTNQSEIIGGYEDDFYIRPRRARLDLKKTTHKLQKRFSPEEPI